MRFSICTLMALCWLISACTPAPAIHLASHTSPTFTTMRVEDFSLYSPLTVEYRPSITDSDQPVLAAAFGSVIGLLLDEPTHQSSQYRSAQLAEQFNNIVGPVNNSLRLRYKLTDTLASTRIQVDQESTTTLQYQLKNRVSEDGRTLEVVTVYRVIDRNGTLDRHTPLSGKTIHVQHRIANSWSKEKLLLVMNNAVTETARLIALDIAGYIPPGFSTALPVEEGGKQYTMPARRFELTAESAFAYHSTPSKLIALSGEHDQPRHYRFAPCAEHC